MEKEIVFNGISYRLMGAGKYYLSQSNLNAGRKHPKGLHVAIWEYYSGKKVPKGYCIHHKDGNTFNNNYDNLECITQKEHAYKHPQHWLNSKDPKSEKIIEMGRESAKEWHKSPEGRQWHSLQSKKSWENREKNDLVCQCCGKHFKSFFNDTKYCSQKCRSKAYNMKKAKVCA